MYKNIILQLLKNSKKMKGLWIPAYIWFTVGLTPTEKCLLAIIGNYEKCYVSNKTLSLQFSIKPKSISNLLASLKRRGFLHMYYENNRRILRLVSFINAINEEEQKENDTFIEEESTFKNAKDTFKDGTINKDKKINKQKKKKSISTATDPFFMDEIKEEEEKQDIENQGGGGFDGFDSAQPPKTQPPVAKLFSEAFPEESLFIFAMTDKIDDVLQYSKLYWSLRKWSESKLLKKDTRARSYDWITVAIAWVRKNPKEFEHKSIIKDVF